MTVTRAIALTEELVARVHRFVPDPGPEQQVAYHSEADYQALLSSVLSARPSGGNVWIFAYGSLLWKPELTFAEERLALAYGWHRSFCMKLDRWRGTKDRPGLMMALDRGGTCRGIAYRLPSKDVEVQLAQLLRREIRAKPPTNVPRWLKVNTALGPLSALGFTMNRKSDVYVGRLPLESVADILSCACGHLGSGAEYLYKTVRHLHERGIADAYLWRLQELVAERISTTCGAITDRRADDMNAI